MQLCVKYCLKLLVLIHKLIFSIHWRFLCLDSAKIQHWQGFRLFTWSSYLGDLVGQDVKRQQGKGQMQDKLWRSCHSLEAVCSFTFAAQCGQHPKSASLRSPCWPRPGASYVFLSGGWRETSFPGRYSISILFLVLILSGDISLLPFHNLDRFSLPVVLLLSA